MIGALSTTFAKELRMVLRRRSAIVLYGAMLVLTVLGLWLVWSEGGAVAWNDQSARALMGRHLFAAVFGVQLIAMSLASALLGSSQISSEREGRTLELLYATGMTRLQILVSKWFASISFEVMVIIGLLPVLSLILQFGGIGQDEFFYVGIILLSTVMTYSMCGIAISAWTRRSFPAQIFSLVLIISISAAPLFFVWFLRGLWLGRLIGSWWSIISPVGCSWDIAFRAFVAPLVSRRNIFGGGGGLATGWLTMPQFYWHLYFQGAVLLTATYMAWRGLAYKEAVRHQVAEKQIDNAAELDLRRKTFPYYLVDPLKRPQAIGDRQNPVYVKETRSGSGSRVTTLIRLSYLCMTISLVMSGWVIGANSASDAWANLATVAFTVLLVFLPLGSATSVSREREEKTLDLLIASGLSSWHIVRAKFWVGFRFAAILGLSLFLMPVVAQFVMGLTGYKNYTAFGAYTENFFLGSGITIFSTLLPFLMLAAFFVALCIYVSSRAKRNVPALFTSYGVLLACTLVPIWLLYVMDIGPYMAGRVDFSELPFLQIPGLWFFIQWISPLVSHFALFDLPSRDRTWHFLQPFNDWQNLLLQAIVMFALTYGVLRLAARQVEKERD